MQKLSYVGIGKHPVTGNTQVVIKTEHLRMCLIANTEVDDTLGLIGKMETMDKIKPGDIANGATLVRDLWSGEIVGYIK